MKRITSLACALLLVPTLAAADPSTPAEWFKEGETQYNLGNFTGAAEAFKKAFALETVDSKKAAYLYNIAQAYRLAKDCTNAQFFYKRFLALRDADTSKPLSEKTRKDIEGWLKELDECARQQEAVRNRPPDNTIQPDGPDAPDTTKPTPPATTETASAEEGDAEDDEDEDGGSVTTTAEIGPRVLSARLAVGGAMIGLGDDSVTRVKGALLAGYPIALNEQLRIEVGAGFTFTSVAYESMPLATSGTASLTAAIANAGVVFAVAPKIALRGDLGAGMLFMGGASMSQFTNGNETEGGALAMPHVRVGIGADYEITPNLAATGMGAFSYSPAKDGLREDISAITSIDFMVGLGYRM